jgi:nucleotide-binding universal stress UspA family protein
MIKDVMVCLEGTAADDVRLAAVEIIAGLFNSHVIGLFLNTVPSTVAVDPNGTGATLLDKAREFGDGVERELAERLTWLNRPTEIHRIDVLHRVRNRTHDVAAALIEEAERLEVDLMVMGGYGHSRLREMLLGGVTYDLLHQAPVPLVIAH